MGRTRTRGPLSRKRNDASQTRGLVEVEEHKKNERIVIALD